jgi:hypothetical protein
MPPTIHMVRGNSTTYEFFKEVLRIIEKGLETFRLLNDA